MKLFYKYKYLIAGLVALVLIGSIIAVVYFMKRKDESFVGADPFVKVCPQKVTLGEIANSIGYDDLALNSYLMYVYANGNQGQYGFIDQVGWAPPATDSTVINNARAIGTATTCYCGKKVGGQPLFSACPN